MRKTIYLSFDISPFTQLYTDYLDGKIDVKTCVHNFFRLRTKHIVDYFDNIISASKKAQPFRAQQWDQYGNTLPEENISPDDNLKYSPFSREAIHVIETDFFHPAEDYTETPVPGMPFQIDEEEFRKQVKAALDKMAELQEKYQDQHTKK